MKKIEDKIILGIDPGTSEMGYGIVHIKGKEMTLVTFGVIHLSKIKEHPDKLKRIFDRVDELIVSYKPDEMAIEAPFFGKNVQSMLKLGRAQGVAIGAALNKNLPFEEYTPKKIKQSITGSGNASKEQVAAMLQRLLNIKELPKYLDATDGLAAAVCHHFQGGIGEHNKSKSGSWKAFISDNPTKIKQR
ncbi:crossover junction endodeoxyribonuclease RuvC [Crocinitomix catalasitica]|uniref:crossover junction endodeoxyribonuclease RuvC n=1 Tax=Crocinitomix catalasitica TaxID=184607 RepID=UPI0004853D2C|nr:crossover junction endodeoxyribonuclease RuvC [Crocinitomix catalasitica]